MEIFSLGFLYFYQIFKLTKLMETFAILIFIFKLTFARKVLQYLHLPSCLLLNRLASFFRNPILLFHLEVFSSKNFHLVRRLSFAISELSEVELLGFTLIQISFFLIPDSKKNLLKNWLKTYLSVWWNKLLTFIRDKSGLHIFFLFAWWSSAIMSL